MRGVGVVEFVAVAVALGSEAGFLVEKLVVLGVTVPGEGVFFDQTFPSSQAHGAAVSAVFEEAFLFGNDVDDWVARLRVDLGSVGVLGSQDMAGVLDYGQLHAVAEAKVGNLEGAGVLDGFDLAFDATPTPTDRDNDTGDAFESVIGLLTLELDAVDPADFEADVVENGGVVEGVKKGGVGVPKLVLAGGKVLADDGDLDGLVFLGFDFFD